MSDSAAILRDVYGHGAAKKIARRFNVAVITAKVWLAGRFPESRTQELADAVRDELDRIDARNQQIRKQLGIEEEELRGIAETSGEAGGSEISGGSVARGAVAERVGGSIAPE